MVERTSTHASPWTIVGGNDRNFARLKALLTVCDRIEGSRTAEPVMCVRAALLVSLWTR